MSTKEHTYMESFAFRPPLKYFIHGMMFLFLSIIFLVAILKGGDSMFLLIVLSFFFLLTFISSIVYLIGYFKNFKGKFIKFTSSEVIIPEKWDKKYFITLKYNNIHKVEKNKVCSRFLEIRTKRTTYIVDQEWLFRKEDLNGIISILNDRCKLE